MLIPRFAAEASLYKARGHYHGARGFHRASGVVLARFGPIRFPFPGGRYCGSCYRDAMGTCVRDCTYCPPGILPDGCSEWTMPCLPSQCPPCCARGCVPC